MRKLTNRRIRMAAIAATLAATAGVLSVPAPTFAATAAPAVAQDEVEDEGPAGDGGEGETEVLTVAEDADLTAAGYGTPIQRDVVMTRAKDWYSRNVPYSQAKSGFTSDVNRGKTYRADCSGFVSMAWKLKTSLVTWTLDDVSHVINWNDLLRGDALVRSEHHAVLFDKWVDADTKADFWVYEEGDYDSDMNHRKMHVVDVRKQGFEPYRYDKIRK